MRKLSITLLKQQFYDLVHEVAAGEPILTTKYGKPLAELRPIAAPQERTLGAMADKFWISEDFDDPLPDDMLDLFEAPR